MYIITGATGHIGSVVADILLSKDEDVLILTRNSEKAKDWKQKGAKTAVIDVNDTTALHEVFKKGKRLFLLNPPGMPDKNMMEQEQRTLRSMLKALENSGIEKIVAESTYGAQAGTGAGDLNTLYDMEQGLSASGIPYTVIRGAYYMSNWDMQLDSAQDTGIIHTMLPVSFEIPMVAPADIGRLAAKLLQEPVNKTGLHHAEGPQYYTPADVADAFSEALHKRVEAVEIPQSQWLQSMLMTGFSAESAKAMAEMTRITVAQGAEKPAEPHKGKISLQQYIRELVNTSTAV